MAGAADADVAAQVTEPAPRAITAAALATPRRLSLNMMVVLPVFAPGGAIIAPAGTMSEVLQRVWY
jgi:hypothetical protein